MNKKLLRGDFADARRVVKATRTHLLHRLFTEAAVPANTPKPEGFIGVYAFNIARDLLYEMDKRARRVVRTAESWDDTTFSPTNMAAIRESMMPVVTLFSGYQHQPDTNQFLPLLFKGVVAEFEKPFVQKLSWGTHSEELDDIVGQCQKRLYGTASAFAEYEFRRRSGYTREM